MRTGLRSLNEDLRTRVSWADGRGREVVAFDSGRRVNGVRVRLAAGDVYRLAGLRGVFRLRVVQGQIWLTGGETGRDWILGAGESMSLDHGLGVEWVMEALVEEAEVVLDFGDDRSA